MNSSSSFDWKRFNEAKTGKKLTRDAVKSSLGIPISGMILFGAPFFLIGAFVTLATLRIGGFEMKSTNSPDWILTVVGVAFLSVGLFIWGMAVNSYRKTQLAQKVAAENPDQPAMQDYPWELTGCSSSRWRPIIKILATAIGLTIFLSIFNWVAFTGKDRPLMMQVVVGLFDVILIFLWWQAYVAFVRALKFGSSRLVWPTFPLRPETLQLNWEPGEGMRTWNRATFTLRCIQETWRTVQTSKGKKESASHEEIWSQVIDKDKTVEMTRNEFVPLAYSIPPIIPGSHLKTASPIFWELEVELEVPGVNFQSRFLVPIYRVNELAETAER